MTFYMDLFQCTDSNWFILLLHFNIYLNVILLKNLNSNLYKHSEKKYIFWQKKINASSLLMYGSE